ncbi:MAG: 4-hydroxyphenylpyruvate dioxygenase [Phycisphaerales bacterium]|nr:4-hydroxyphenylpyruvate dioxygenase [Phycisphaerales bacterium]MCI0677187.1 4-hydroxyphenylpyruvate dioxygenase [Phycisphaerales bacterium]
MTTAKSTPTMKSPGTAPGAAGQKTDPLQLIDVDHVRFYVGNARQAAHFYASTFGFQVQQIADLTTGSRDAAHYLLTQGNIRFVLTTGLTKEHPASKHVMNYGDGVKDIAFTVFDAAAAYERALKNGGESAQAPTEYGDDSGATVVSASVKTFGPVVHSFISRPRAGKYSLPEVKQGSEFMPKFKKVANSDYHLNDYNIQHPCGLKFVDHLVGNVEMGAMNKWVAWYENVLEFRMFKHFDDKDISTEYSALMSKVMASGNQLIKIPINEPAEGKRKSQVQEYLDFTEQVPGVQHLALRTDDELSSIAELRRRGVDFLAIPDAYYETVWQRIESTLKQHGHTAGVKEDHKRVKELGILVDADDEGYLLQLFTKPLQDRPTLFFEIICRRGSQSFGKGNFKALFQALEAEQERRGNL